MDPTSLQNGSEQRSKFLRNELRGQGLKNSVEVLDDVPTDEEIYMGGVVVILSAFELILPGFYTVLQRPIQFEPDEETWGRRLGNSGRPDLFVGWPGSCRLILDLQDNERHLRVIKEDWHQKINVGLIGSAQDAETSLEPAHKLVGADKRDIFLQFNELN